MRIPEDSVLWVKKKLGLSYSHFEHRAMEGRIADQVKSIAVTLHKKDLWFGRKERMNFVILVKIKECDFLFSVRMNMREKNWFHNTEIEMTMMMTMMMMIAWYRIYVFCDFSKWRHTDIWVGVGQRTKRRVNRFLFLPTTSPSPQKGTIGMEKGLNGWWRGERMPCLLARLMTRFYAGMTGEKRGNESNG